MLKLSWIIYIYANLGMDLDYILPFASIPENSRQIDGLDDKSELAHRMMLVNLLRILGAVKNKKASRHFVTRPEDSLSHRQTVPLSALVCTAEALNASGITDPYEGAALQLKVCTKNIVTKYG